jgi:hypothetical protein
VRSTGSVTPTEWPGGGRAAEQYRNAIAQGLKKYRPTE